MEFLLYLWIIKLFIDKTTIMGIITRILGLTSKKNELETQKRNLEIQDKDTKEIKLDISVTNILLYSAKTQKK